MKLMKKKMKKPRCVFPGRFGALTGRPGDLMKNLETPGKTGRVGRYVLNQPELRITEDFVCLSRLNKDQINVSDVENSPKNSAKMSKFVKIVFHSHCTFSKTAAIFVFGARFLTVDHGLPVRTPALVSNLLPV